MKVIQGIRKKSKENKLCPYLLDGVRVTVVDCSKRGGHLGCCLEIGTVGEANTERVETREEFLLSIFVCDDCVYCVVISKVCYVVTI